MQNKMKKFAHVNLFSYLCPTNKTITMEKKHFDVVAAIIRKDSKYLCMQRCRSHHNYISEHWEFPGGRVEDGECHHETLLREIKEEMDWDIYVGQKLASVEHEYPDFSITLTAYECMSRDENFKLLEHLDYQWLEKKDLLGLNWTAADRELILKLAAGEERNEGISYR